MTLARGGDHLTLVRDLTESLLPSGLSVAVRDPSALPTSPDAMEDTAVAAAVPQRRAEFHAGRAAARAAMVAQDLPPLPVPSDIDRAPIWPEGVVGSISHCRTACVAVIGKASDWLSVGVDLEEDTPFATDLLDIVCDAAERRWLEAQDDPGVLAKVIFCAKEAAYKAQYPLTKALFGFDHLRITVNERDASFLVEFLAEAGHIPRGQTFQGRYAHAAGVLIAAVALRAEDISTNGV